MFKIAKIYIKTCIDNVEYIEMNKFDVFCLADVIKSREAEKERQLLLSKILEYEKLNKKNIIEIVIRKDSMLGEYILTSSKEKISNLDDIITFEKITNALNIAVFESNPIAKKLITPFMKQACGYKEYLICEYGKEVVDYIVLNSDFNIYIQKINGTYCPKKYYVYENGEITNRTLIEKENVKIK